MDTNSKIREVMLRSASEAAETYLRNGAMEVMCESEIERIMMAAFFAQQMNFFNYPRFFVAFHSSYKELDGIPGLLRRSKELIEVGCLDCVVWPQAPIGSYRADFLCVGSDCTDGGTIPLAVECDGHDFHERTKQQAQRGKARDRFFVAQSVPAMRFTGSEIWRDAPACVAEVANYFLKIESKRRVA